MSDVPLPGSFGRDSSTVSTIANLLVSEDLVMKLGDLGHVCGWDETNWIEGESRCGSLSVTLYQKIYEILYGNVH